MRNNEFVEIVFVDGFCVFMGKIWCPTVARANTTPEMVISTPEMAFSTPEMIISIPEKADSIPARANTTGEMVSAVRM
jgi:hypothetical protein